jgi:hypothetical protein
MTFYGGVQCANVPLFEIYVMLRLASGLSYCGKITLLHTLLFVLIHFSFI